MVVEQALVFNCAQEQLLGVASLPDSAGPLGVLILVGGPQYRVGSHRQFLLLARRLAAAGIPAMRFDFRGMGDSDGAERDFAAVGDDIAAAIAAFFTACPGLRQVALWGLCDAASAALLYWQTTRDPRIAGLALLNPWVRSETGLARTRVRHYYRERLLQPAFWKKLFSGRLHWLRSLREASNNLRLALAGRRQSASSDASFQARMASAMQHFPGPVLLVLSGDDYVAKEFRDWADAQAGWSNWQEWPHLTCHCIEAADHTFSSAPWREQVEQATLAWLGQSGKLR